MKDNSYKDFRDQLDDHHKFPSIYIFKFILPANNIEHLKKVLPEDQLQLKPSRNGKYISATAKVMMNSAEEVVEIYKQTSLIEGIIQL